MFRSFKSKAHIHKSQARLNACYGSQPEMIGLSITGPVYLRQRLIKQLLAMNINLSGIRLMQTHVKTPQHPLLPVTVIAGCIIIDQYWTDHFWRSLPNFNAKEERSSISPIINGECIQLLKGLESIGLSLHTGSASALRWQYSSPAQNRFTED